jgi:hypothetical protein
MTCSLSLLAQGYQAVLREMLRKVVRGLSTLGIKTVELEEAARVLDMPHVILQGSMVSDIFVNLPDSVIVLMGRWIAGWISLLLLNT